MNWNTLESEQTLTSAIESSDKQPVLIFKHSTRCSISSAALDRIERNWKGEITEAVMPYYLDLIAHRNISNKIADLSGVEHQSPQALLFINGKCVYHASHMSISLHDILRAIKLP